MEGQASSGEAGELTDGTVEVMAFSLTSKHKYAQADNDCGYNISKTDAHIKKNTYRNKTRIWIWLISTILGLGKQSLYTPLKAYRLLAVLVDDLGVVV